LKILITICARGGSKGIPLKNIKPLAGKPLIEYTIETARQFKNEFVDVDIALSTDSQDVINIAVLQGLEVPYLRPDFLATDKAGKVVAIKDVLLFYEKLKKSTYDFILDLDVTSPLRSLNDLSKAFQLILNDKSAYTIFSVSPANRNPYFNMVEQGVDGYYHLSKKLSGDILSRQSAPRVYDMNASFYFYRRIFFDKEFNSAITDKSLIYDVPHICFDLDHPVDFEFLSFLILNNKLDFDWL
jgi:CMP-N,N'-diacetyllegionaminic acid synthase